MKCAAPDDCRICDGEEAGHQEGSMRTRRRLLVLAGVLALRRR